MRQAPNDVPARLQLADQYIRNAETFAAIEQLEVARELGDDDVGLSLRLAEQYTALGEIESAAGVLSDAVTKHPSPEARLAWSRALLKLGDFRAAASAVRPLTARWSALPTDAQQAVARALLLAGESRQASTLIPADSSDPIWLGLRGQQALLEGQPKVAVVALTRATASNTPDGRSLVLLGRALLAAGEPRNALDAWNRALETANAPAQAAIEAARLLLHSNRLDEAEAVLQRVPGPDRKAPGFWEVQSQLAQQRALPVLARLARGYTAFNSGDPWQAEAIWQSALPKASDEDAFAIDMALFNSAAWRQAAQDSYRYVTSATARFPQDFYFLKSRAEVLKDLNRPTEAEAIAKSLQALEPADKAGQAADLQARIALKFGEADLLARSVARQRALAPQDPNGPMHLVEWQLRQPHTSLSLESALKLCQEAISLDPNNAEAHFHAGLILNELKRPDEAISMLLHSLTLSPRLEYGAVNATLHQVEQREGLNLESRFEVRRNRELRTPHDDWASRDKILYLAHPAPTLAEWKTLGDLALGQHETWIALCAAVRASRLAPRDPAVWRLMAAAWHRLGQRDEALAAMMTAHRPGA